MIDKIKDYVKENHKPDDFKYHILPVVKNALVLAENLDADKEVVEAAAFLHDIGCTVEGYRDIDNIHHEHGAKIASDLLEKLGYNREFIERVAHCVLSHRARKGPSPETIEAEIVANADAMSHFDAFIDLVRYFTLSLGSFEKAVLFVEKKIERDWENKLTLPLAKEMAREKYNSIMILINSMKKYF